MTYKMFDQDLKEILTSEKAYHQREAHSFSTNKKTTTARYGKFKIKETSYKEVYIGSCEYSVRQDTELYSSIRDEMICFSIMNKGRSQFSCESIENCRLEQHTCNLFYLNGANTTRAHLQKGCNNEVVDIIISKNHLLELTARYPAIFGALCNRIEKKQSFAVFKNGILATPEIALTFNQIKESNLLGNTAALYVEAKVQELFALFLGTPSVTCNRHGVSCALRNKMYEVKQLLEECYQTPPSLAQLAQQVGTSETSLKTCFKKIFGQTVFGYLVDYRLNKAVQLLKNRPELNISEIAFLTGYEHAPHFCTAFKRKFGYPPKTYRNIASRQAIEMDCAIYRDE